MSSAPVARVEALDLLELLARQGVSRVSGVPCSSMTGLINAAQAGVIVPYANAPNEGEALAYGAGSWLGGGLTAILCQNSGLGNLYNCLTSLCLPYAIPTVILCGWRGMPGMSDEPQHRVMGRLTPALFTAAGIEPSLLDVGVDPAGIVAKIDPNSRNTAAILVSPGALRPERALRSVIGQRPQGELRRQFGNAVLDRREAIAFLSRLPSQTSGIVVSTGLLSREYFAASDDSNLFCMAGSMGHAAALALGAHAQSGVAMLAIEGDGSIMMRPQSLAFVGSEAPASFCHVVVDNGVHESTGGQASLAATCDLAAAAVAFGYRLAVDTADCAVAASAVELGLGGSGPVFVRLRIRPGGDVPPRIGIAFEDMASRFRAFIRSAAVRSKVISGAA